MLNSRLLTIGLLLTALAGRAPAAEGPATTTAPSTRPSTASDDAIAVAESRLNHAEAAYQQAVRQLSDARQVLMNMTGRVDVSPEGLQKSAGRLDEQIESLELDLYGARARRRALEKVIAESEAKAEKHVQNDLITEELAKIVGIREQAVAREEQLRKTGTVPEAGVRVALAEAKVKLAERQHEVVASSGGEALAAWNRELLNISVSEAEYLARMDILHTRRGQLQQAQPTLEKAQYWQDTLRVAQEEMQAALKQRDLLLLNARH